MSLTQIHAPELYPDIIFDMHVNALAQIQGFKILPGTILERGTVQFANEGEIAALKAVQANDTRMHYQGTDTGTTANTFLFNSDAVLGDNTTIVLGSSDTAAGGGFRYNDTLGRMEFTYNYNGARDWKQIASTSDLGNGIVYRTAKLGSQSDDSPINTIYSLNNGNFSIDGDKLIVFINGQFKSHYSNDYTIIDTNSIQFVYSIEPDDNIEMLVYADIYFRTGLLGTDSFDVLRTQYIISGIKLTEDYQSVMVYVNGQLKTANPPGGGIPDYVIMNDHLIQFTYPRNDDDNIEVLVASVGTVKSVIETSFVQGTTSDTFRVACDSNDMGDYYLLFGSGNGYDVGFRSYNGNLYYQNYGGTWTLLDTSASAANMPDGVDNQILVKDSLGTYGYLWKTPAECKLLPEGAAGYMLVSDPTTASGVRWTQPPLTGSTLPAGPDGYVLVADHTAPMGVKWVKLTDLSDDDDIIVNPVGTTSNILMYDSGVASHVSWSSYIDVNSVYTNTSSIPVTGAALLNLPATGSNGYILTSNTAAIDGSGFIWVNVIDTNDDYGPEHSVSVSITGATLPVGPNGYTLFTDTNDTTKAYWTNIIDGGSYNG